jgi:hypothetical protein
MCVCTDDIADDSLQDKKCIRYTINDISFPRLAFVYRLCRRSSYLLENGLVRVFLPISIVSFDKMTFTPINVASFLTRVVSILIRKIDTVIDHDVVTPARPVTVSEENSVKAYGVSSK